MSLIENLPITHGTNFLLDSAADALSCNYLTLVFGVVLKGIAAFIRRRRARHEEKKRLAKEVTCGVPSLCECACLRGLLTG